MGTGRKIVKVFLWILGVIIICIVGLAAYIYFGKSGNRNALSVIPNDAIYIIETNNLTKGWSAISGSKIWQNLMASPTFDEINAQAMSLDSIIKGNNTLDMLFSGRQMAVSAHMISDKDYDFVFAVDLKKISKISFLKNYIRDIVGYYDLSFSKRDFEGVEIIELASLTSKDVISLCFIENVLVCSYSRLLVEKSILQKDLEFWAKNADVRFVTTEIRGSKLFNLYLNFNQLNNYLQLYLSEPSALLVSMSNSLRFSAFNVSFDDEMLQWEGYTSVNDSQPSYFNALADVGPGKWEAYDIISDKAAVYISMSFKNQSDFFKKLKEVYKTEDTVNSQSYEKIISKVEKILKININEDFFGWIGNEIAFVKLQPSSNAREEDAIAIIHASDITKAKDGMNKITRNVRKKTLGLLKFNDTEYKNYTIRYLEYGWFLKLLFGKLFSKFDKPYYIFLENYVVFSNSPSCLLDIIDDYNQGSTLARNTDFMKFISNFESKSNISAFVQMPKVYSHIYYYGKADKKEGIKKNKDIILSFDRIGFQLTSDDKMYKTKFYASFDEEAAFYSELENIESAAEELYYSEIDSGKFKVTLTTKDFLKGGAVRVYYEDSITLKAEGRVVNGKVEGLWRSYYESGGIKSTVTYQNGFANGVAFFYFDNDRQTTRVELTFEDDKINGQYREFYENGNRKAMLEFSEDSPDGDAEFYYDSGVIKIEGQYEKGVKKGKWKHFTETGQLISKEKWKKEKQQK